MFKNTKACRRPSLFVAEFLVSATLLASALYVPYQNPLAISVWAQAASAIKAKSGKVRGRNWHIFKSPDGEFTLSFPGKPSTEETTPGPFTDIRGYRFTTAYGLTFAINLQDIGGDPRATRSNEWGEKLERALSEEDRKQGLRVVQMRRLAKNIVEFELWQTVPETNSNINYLRRTIIKRSRVYTLSCGWVIDGKRVDRTVCRRFFNSMQFTPAH